MAPISDSARAGSSIHHRAQRAREGMARSMQPGMHTRREGDGGRGVLKCCKRVYKVTEVFRVRLLSQPTLAYRSPENYSSTLTEI